MRATQSAFPAKRAMKGAQQRWGRGEEGSNWLCGLLAAAAVAVVSARQAEPSCQCIRLAWRPFAIARCPLPVCSGLVSSYGAAIYRKSVANATTTPRYAYPLLYPALWLIGNQPKLVTIEIAFGQWIMINKSMEALAVRRREPPV